MINNNRILANTPRPLCSAAFPTNLTRKHDRSSVLSPASPMNIAINPIRDGGADTSGLLDYRFDPWASQASMPAPPSTSAS